MALAVLVLPQVAAAGRHLDRVPEEQLKRALAMEVLLSWSRACPDAGLGYGALPWDAPGLRAMLDGLARSLLHGAAPAALLVGGVHLRALGLLINGSEELHVSALERLLLNSVSALISAGVPYQLVEEAVSSPSVGSLLRLFAYSSRVPSVGRCLEVLAPRVISFCIYAERGDVGRARALAEEVLNSGSALFGVLMVSALGRASPAGRGPRAPALDELPEEFAEKLVSILRERNVSIGEVLARYSIAELVELYEKLASAAGADLGPEVGGSAMSDLGRYGGVPPVAGVDEDLLRPALAGSQGVDSGRSPASAGSSGEPAGERRVRELLSRIPPSVLSSAVSIASGASFERYLGATRAPRAVAQPTDPADRGETPSWGPVLAAVAVAASVGGLYHLVLRGGGTSPLRWAGARRPVMEVRPAEELSPVVKLFWSVVGRLAAAVDVEILPSDTHREIVDKIGPRVDDVTSAGLRRLGKLYEAARYSRGVAREVLERELEALSRLLGG